MDDNKKRIRDDSEDLELAPPESKRVRVDSEGSGGESPQLDRVIPDEKNPEVERVDSDGDSFEETYIPDNLLDILDDAEPAEPEVKDLDSVIRSFEEEINVPPTTGSESGESQPELGYLLEASDDELGLPPTATTTSASSEFAPSDYSNAHAMYGFQDEILSYVSYGIGADSDDVYTSADYDGNDGGGFVMFDGLFDGSDFSEFLYRPESLPAS